MDRHTPADPRALPRTGRPRRWPLALAAAATGLALSTPGATTPAHAESATRYWSTWTVSEGDWVEPEQGPRTAVPQDGTTVGLRYAMISRHADEGRPPRSAPNWPATCEGVPPQEGMKRIAVVVDFGRLSDDPDRRKRAAQVEATCATVPVGLTTEQTLHSVLSVEDHGQGICSVNGHPRTGCEATRVRDADEKVLSEPDRSVEASVGSPESPDAVPEVPEPAVPSAPDETGTGSPGETSGVPSAAPSSTDTAGAPGTTQEPSGGESAVPTADDELVADSQPVRSGLVPWWGTALLVGLVGGLLWLLLRPLPRSTRRPLRERRRD